MRDFNFHTPLGAESAPWEPPHPVGRGWGHFPVASPCMVPVMLLCLTSLHGDGHCSNGDQRCSKGAARGCKGEQGSLLPHGRGTVRYPHASFLLPRPFPCISGIKELCHTIQLPRPVLKALHPVEISPTGAGNIELSRWVRHWEGAELPAVMATVY